MKTVSVGPGKGLVTSPHYLASEAGADILRKGGNAIEAAVATAATLAVVYPHMNGIGGDGFWLIAEPGRPPRVVEACGPSGERVDADLFRSAGHESVPTRGPLSANTVAGTIGGWQAALVQSAEWGGTLALPALIERAIGHAADGYPVSAFQAAASESHGPDFAAYPGFADQFLCEGSPTPKGSTLKQPALAETLRTLSKDGLDSFYRGALGDRIAADVVRFGVPLTRDDLAAYQPRWVEPLTYDLGDVRLFNTPPPTQGLASMLILGLACRIGLGRADSFRHVHGLVEATKRAFTIRDTIVGDPSVSSVNPAAYLDDDWLDAEAASINVAEASDWQARAGDGDTVWLGVVDAEGRSVSMIQSIYLKFGSGVVLPETGILWQNRGAAFALQPGSPRTVGPRRLPFHTLNPAMADFSDGRRMTYGTMGGDGQPQFQAALFTRYAFFGQDLQDSISAPRWLLGRFPSDGVTFLRVESDLGDDVINALGEAGHNVLTVPPTQSLMGHAGAIVRHPDGTLDGATDPRSDGAVVPG